MRRERRPIAPYRPANMSDAEWNESERQRIERQQQREGMFNHRLQRMRAIGANDGQGVCRWCGARLVRDSDDVDLHPDGECVGPGTICADCGIEYRGDACTACITRRAATPPSTAKHAAPEMKPVRQARLFGYDD